jgi:hypothetical protein
MNWIVVYSHAGEDKFCIACENWSSFGDLDVIELDVEVLIDGCIVPVIARSFFSSTVTCTAVSMH